MTAQKGNKAKTHSEKMKGNSYGTKLKIPEIRQQAYLQYCQWIAEGKPKKAWCFEHPKFTCSYRTMDKYIAENPDEFPPIHKEISECKGYALWFQRGVDMLTGESKNCQPAVYQMIMRNMFDWDKENSGQKETTEPLVKTMANRWRGKGD